MPYRLDHINVWIIEDGSGWALVDTGLRTQETMDIWAEMIARPPLSGPLTRVLATHSHADHLGLAGWLTRKHGVELWISRREYLMCRTLLSDRSNQAPAHALQFYRQAGWGEEAVERYRIRFGDVGAQFSPLPDSFRSMQDGMRLQIGRNEWEVVIGSGHSPEGASLYCPALKVLISGDHILPHISSNVPVYHSEPEANPLAEWFSSMEHMKRRIPDDVLVAPGHHDVFRGLHARIDHLVRGQWQALDRLRMLLAQPRRVVDVFGALFRSLVSEADPDQLWMATGEALANLNYLIGAGEAVKVLRDGIAWYQRPRRSGHVQRADRLTDVGSSTECGLSDHNRISVALD
ncbi:MBL fold metallo-hydrolase [Bradyrhizobium sacchari]|nr:MBL fold metallo-hydrolase [Bradyrhizobium sacchari]